MERHRPDPRTIERWQGKFLYRRRVGGMVSRPAPKNIRRGPRSWFSLPSSPPVDRGGGCRAGLASLRRLAHKIQSAWLSRPNDKHRRRRVPASEQMVSHFLRFTPPAGTLFQKGKFGKRRSAPTLLGKPSTFHAPRRMDLPLVLGGEFPTAPVLSRHVSQNRFQDHRKRIQSGVESHHLLHPYEIVSPTRWPARFARDLLANPCFIRSHLINPPSSTISCAASHLHRRGLHPRGGSMKAQLVNSLNFPSLEKNLRRLG